MWDLPVNKSTNIACIVYHLNEKNILTLHHSNILSLAIFLIVINRLSIEHYSIAAKYNFCALNDTVIVNFNRQDVVGSHYSLSAPPCLHSCNIFLAVKWLRVLRPFLSRARRKTSLKRWRRRRGGLFASTCTAASTSTNCSTWAREQSTAQMTLKPHPPTPYSAPPLTLVS